MTGTGTQNDPYIISDWTDFITAVGTSNAYVEFPKNLVHTSDTNVDPNKLYTDANGVIQTNVQASDLVNLYENTFVLDANDYAPEGLSASISINCASLKGFGGTIRNLASSSTNIISTYSYVNFTGIAFLNVRCTGVHFFVSSRNNSWGTVSKCIFTGRMDGSQTCRLIWASWVHFVSCAFNVQLYDSSDFAENNEGYNQFLDFNYCRINTEDHRTASTYARNYMTTNSIWTGNYRNYITISMSLYDYTVYDLECASIGASNDGIAAYTFINSDKCASIRGVAVTTEELQSASALAAKGFPIQV